jgi:hypothetical protein
MWTMPITQYNLGVVIVSEKQRSPLVEQSYEQNVLNQGSQRLSSLPKDILVSLCEIKKELCSVEQILQKLLAGANRQVKTSYFSHPWENLSNLRHACRKGQVKFKLVRTSYFIRTRFWMSRRGWVLQRFTRKWFGMR